MPEWLHILFIQDFFFQIKKLYIFMGRMKSKIQVRINSLTIL